MIVSPVRIDYCVTCPPVYSVPKINANPTSGCKSRGRSVTKFADSRHQTPTPEWSSVDFWNCLQFFCLHTQPLVERETSPHTNPPTAHCPSHIFRPGDAPGRGSWCWRCWCEAAVRTIGQTSPVLGPLPFIGH